jgi:integrase
LVHFDGPFNSDRTTMVLPLAAKVREAAASDSTRRSIAEPLLKINCDFGFRHDAVDAQNAPFTTSTSHGTTALWRSAREELGVPEATTHGFRKTVATPIDDEGLSARIGASHLGHSYVSMTQDRNMTRSRVDT